MSRRSLTTGLLLFVSALAGYAAAVAQERAPAAPELKTLEEKASYAIGLNIGGSILEDDLGLNPDIVAKGLVDALKKAKPQLTPEQVREVMTAFSKQAQVKAEAKAKLTSEKNVKDGAAFLAENKKKKGVTTTESGLQYEVVTAGKGATPKPTDVVKVHYHGTLLDGTVFDSSVDRKEPAEFPVNRVIAGWTEALQKMKVGDKWKLVIPAELAYRATGTPDGTIGPNAVLKFDVELLDIVK
jgi:FKBP-type peptidyl-prolyl cis-trans isomerase FklB